MTAGTHSDLRTVLVSKLQPHSIKQTAPELLNVLAAVQELETLLSFDKLDIEFAVDTSGQVHIFQVRPVVVNHDNYELDAEKIASSIQSDVVRYQELQKSLPFISCDKTIFANMPDWKGSIGLFFISDRFLSVNFATSPYILALSGDFASHATFYKLSQNGN